MTATTANRIGTITWNEIADTVPTLADLLEWARNGEGGAR